MAISDTTRADVTQRLQRDIRATVGSDRHLAVQASIDNGLIFHTDPHHFTQWVVDDVQQLFHDTFVDTTWPRCPRHPQHPLWLTLRNGEFFWCCHNDNMPIARLGELDYAGGYHTEDGR